MLASAPVDFHVTDTYFVVAHLHYVLFGGSVFAAVRRRSTTGSRSSPAGCCDERLGQGPLLDDVRRLQPHVLRAARPRPGGHAPPGGRLPRRATGSPALNQISTIGAFLLGASTLPFLWNVWRTRCRHGPPAGNDPWDGQTLEWATTSPPPERNFDPLPPIRSERPVWDLKSRPTSRCARSRVKTMKVEVGSSISASPPFFVVDRRHLLVHVLRGRRHDDARGQLAPRARSPGGYLLLQARRFPPRPEDRPDATLAEGSRPGRPVPGVERLAVRVRRFGAQRCSLDRARARRVVVARRRRLVLVLGVIGLIRQQFAADVPRMRPRRSAVVTVGPVPRRLA